MLEPGCGTGNFMAMPRPGSGSSASSWIRISGRIARALHPDADIRIENFRDTQAARRVDAVIGNPPFADVRLDYRGQKLSLHDFFIAKSLDALKPGGILALVTSHFTLDKQNAATREYLAEPGGFPGSDPPAVRRLQAGRHVVVTDILFLRKRAAGAGSPTTPTRTGWTPRRSASTASTSPINRYFLNHPEMVLGDLEPQGHALRRRAATASSATATWPRSSTHAIRRLPEARSSSRDAERPNPPARLHPAAARSGTSPRAVSSSATTRSSTRSKAGRACPSPMAARCSRPTAP